MAGDGCTDCQIIGKQFLLAGVMAGDGCANCQIIGKQFSLAGIEIYRYKGSA